ncbi:MAG: class I SAM-dependent methyltransferase [Candidatus Eisenbacteria bacterium]
MSNHSKVAFFDGIAEQWDGWECLKSLARKFDDGLRAFGVGTGETVLDIGCGTGNLTTALLNHLSADGRVEAVDISPRMIETARGKVSDARVRWHLAEAEHLPLGDGSCDRAICYSVWPHFEDPKDVARELRRVLRPGGRVHVWHLISRERVNQVHADAGEAICRDHLPPVQDLADLFTAQGFEVTTAVETPDSYILSAAKPVG